MGQLTLILSHILYLFVRFIFYIVETAIRAVLSYFGCNASSNRSAERRRILWRSKIDELDFCSDSHFLTIHADYIDPSVILQDNVVLYDINAHYAIFLELPHSIQSGYTADRAQFMFIKTFRDAQSVIRVPLSSLHRVAELVGAFRTKVILISNSGRCGSTLLIKMMTALSPQNVLSLSEPGYYSSLLDLKIRRLLSPEEFDKVLKSVFAICYQPRNRSQSVSIDTYIVKVRWWTIEFMETVDRVFGSKVKHIYLHRRNHLRTVESSVRAFGDVFWFRLIQLLTRLRVLHVIQKLAGVKSDPRILANSHLIKGTIFEICFSIWADHYLTYQRVQKSIPAMKPVEYEDLVAEPEKVLGELANAFDLPTTNLAAGIAAINEDAQKESHLAREILREKKVESVSPEAKQRLIRFSRAVGVPDPF